MSTPDNTPVKLMRPRDESVEAMKDFYVELCDYLEVEIPPEFMNDDEYWKAKTEKFWNKANAGKS